MKMFTVPVGTMGWVRNADGKECRFRTTKQNIFTETVNDPIALYNNRNLARPNTDSWTNSSARAGNAVFQDDEHPNWFLIVAYNNVKVN